MVKEKERDISIDILKFIAVILIINSHMDAMYPHCKMLATGGAIGDTVFLFCSGFTLFLGRMDRFDNWYKRRISRIYPTVFSWALVSSVFFQSTLTAKDIVIWGGEEFVTFIMLYYVLLYVIHRYFKRKLLYVYGVWGFLVLLIYIYFFPYKYETSLNGIYGISTYFRWLPYFLFILLGAHIGISRKEMKFNGVWDFIKLIVNVLLFYGIQLLSKKYNFIAPVQIITVLPLLGTVVYLYKVCNASFFKYLYSQKYTHILIMFVSGLCLESYIVQGVLFTSKLNNLFPLNLLLIFMVIMIVAYFVKCLSVLFLQTFSNDSYRWKDVFKIY